MNNVKLIGFRSRRGTSLLFHEDGTLIGYFPSYMRQPDRRKKTININCWEYDVEWIGRCRMTEKMLEIEKIIDRPNSVKSCKIVKFE